MIITKAYALRLIRSGKATIQGETCTGCEWPWGAHLTIINRLDCDRTDHYYNGKYN